VFQSESKSQSAFETISIGGGWYGFKAYSIDGEGSSEWVQGPILAMDFETQSVATFGLGLMFSNHGSQNVNEKTAVAEFSCKIHVRESKSGLYLGLEILKGFAWGNTQGRHTSQILLCLSLGVTFMRGKYAYIDTGIKLVWPQAFGLYAKINFNIWKNKPE